MTLSNSDMRYAHLARQIDMDPNCRGDPEAWARMTWLGDPDDAEGLAVWEEQCAVEYAAGREVLAKYMMGYSARYVVGTSPPALAADEQAIAVSAGHIATNEANRLAVFRLIPRARERNRNDVFAS